MTDAEKALRWLATGEVGASSKTIAFVLSGQNASPYDYPRDPSDLNRCIKLLDLYPEWRDRLGEVATLSPYWAALIERWADLEATFHEEAGPDWSKARSAPRTYNLMREILLPIEDADKNVVRLGRGVTIRFGGTQ